MKTPLSVDELLQNMRLTDLATVRRKLVAIELHDKTLYLFLCQLFKPKRKCKTPTKP